MLSIVSKSLSLSHQQTSTIIIKNYVRNCSTKATANPIIRRKAKGVKIQDTFFIDQKNVQVHGGKGGDGCISFMKTSVSEFAGPDGGDGGNGGHVLFQASFDVKSLGHIPTIIKGSSGDKGQPKNCYGQNALPTVIKVPFGTLFKDETGDLIADLCSINESVFVAARGGSGGRGNKFFATPENQTPEVCEFGAEGETKCYDIQMSTIAHIGLVGFPNAGKSTILRAITRARPKVASYPFTTLRPHVGMVLYDDLEQIAVADIPGIIEDSHKNRGLGISFLRHIQRCLCLAYVVDMSGYEPWAVLETLYTEVSQFDNTMIKRPSIILANKMDLPDSKEAFLEFKQIVGDKTPIIPISAKTGLNLKQLLYHIRTLYDEEMKTIDMTETTKITHSWHDWDFRKQ